MEIVINKCFGGFSLSNKAIERYYELKGQKVYFYKETNFQSHVYIKTDCNDTSYYVNAYSKDFGDKVTGNIDMYSLYYSKRELKRDDPVLIKVVKELGEEANGDCAYLKIVEVPDYIQWEIHDYDGMESVEEAHDSWS